MLTAAKLPLLACFFVSAGCVIGSSPMGYPLDWAPLRPESTNCPDLTGAYRFVGEGADYAGRYKSLLTAFLDHEKDSAPGQDATHVQIAGPAADRFDVSIWRHTVLLYRRQLTTADFSCSAGALELTGGRLRGMTFRRGQDATLVSRYDNIDALPIMIVIASNKKTIWNRWSPYDSSRTGASSEPPIAPR